jgi:hypothetical protein
MKNQELQTTLIGVHQVERNLMRLVVNLHHKDNSFKFEKLNGLRLNFICCIYKDDFFSFQNL